MNDAVKVRRAVIILTVLLSLKLLLECQSKGPLMCLQETPPYGRETNFIVKKLIVSCL